MFAWTHSLTMKSLAKENTSRREDLRTDSYSVMDAMRQVIKAVTEPQGMLMVSYTADTVKTCQTYRAAMTTLRPIVATLPKENSNFQLQVPVAKLTEKLETLSSLETVAASTKKVQRALSFRCQRKLAEKVLGFANDALRSSTKWFTRTSVLFRGINKTVKNLFWINTTNWNQVTLNVFSART